MSNFVTDGTVLPYPKVDLTTLAATADATRYVRAVDWNALCQALVDIRTFLTADSAVFRYTVQGGDTATITIPLPQTRSDTAYNVQVTMGEFTNLLVAAAPPSLYTTAHFVLKLAGTPTVGDTFLFTIASQVA